MIETNVLSKPTDLLEHRFRLRVKQAGAVAGANITVLLLQNGVKWSL